MFKPMLLAAILCVASNGVLFSASWQETGKQDQSKDNIQTGSAPKANQDTTTDPLPAAVDAVVYQQTVSKAVDYLLTQGQDKTDGSFSKSLGPAVTAMCTTALLKNGVPIQNSAVQKSLKYLESFIQPDGGVYPPGSNLRNYETSVAVMCFKQANADGKYDKTIEQAVGFLKNLQWDDGEGHSKTSAYYGGQGYGSHQRPDASNTSFFLDALKAVGEDPESAAMQKALTFMSRCQNLQSPHNGEAFVQKVDPDDRGGSIYSPVNGGESKAGAREDGGLRSYASMTYAGLKSFLYAGVKKDDIRVKAAMDWISRHYDLKTNPGMGEQGLFYYYHVFAKALDANGEARIMDARMVPHNWRAELVLQLSDVQRQDGSWTNSADRWFEGDPNLTTSYALLALSYCHPDKDSR
jgi:squalene-hopene/tetraprenyl-beta-curcumene cyclase